MMACLRMVCLAKRGMLFACVLSVCLLLMGCVPSSLASEPVNGTDIKASVNLMVSAASSLAGILPALVGQYREGHPHVGITLNFGASGSLRRQIEEGAAVDLFISASAEHMDALDDQGLLAMQTRRDLLKNEVVLVVPAGMDIPASSNPQQCLASAEFSKIGIGEPDSVPAGAYAWTALGEMGLLETLTPRLVYAKNVREALAWVETGNLDAAFVFRTDALSSEQVAIATVLSETMTGPITYPVAMLADSAQEEAVLAFLDWLDGDEAWPAFERAGFVRVE